MEKDVKSMESEYYDKHYQSLYQPIEFMQENLTHVEFIGFLKGNIIKYVGRLGRKDEPSKEVAKIKRYIQWLEKAVKNERINLREI